MQFILEDTFHALRFKQVVVSSLKNVTKQILNYRVGVLGENLHSASYFSMDFTVYIHRGKKKINKKLINIQKESFQRLRVDWWNFTPCIIFLPEQGNEIL